MWMRQLHTSWHRSGVPRRGEPPCNRSRAPCAPQLIQRKLTIPRATYYDVLGVDATSSVDDIKSAFRRKVKLVHPDVSKSADSDDEFIRLKEAYDTLTDSRQRAEYDAALARARRRASGARASSSSRGGSSSSSNNSGFRQRVVVVQMGGLDDDDDDDDDGDDGVGFRGGQPFMWGSAAWEDLFEVHMGDDDDDDSDDDDDDEEEDEEDDDEEDDDEGGLLDELEYMAWAGTANNFTSSFQSSWQANSRKQRRAAAQQQQQQQAFGRRLTPEEKDVLLSQLPGDARTLMRHVFGPRLESLGTLEELAEVLSDLQEMSDMGVEFE
ncbi:hypothetical protein Agub_g15349, partial [Astrephomene gubernaculifera]